MSETATVKRTNKKGRVCCEVTLKFYSQYDQIAEPTKEQAATRERLVKWIVAPDKETMRAWLEANRLSDHLDGPIREMPAFMSESYSEKEGVDVILAAPKKGKEVTVTFPESFDPAEWRKAVLNAAEVHLKSKMKWNADTKKNEWKSGKYKIHMGTIREEENYFLAVELAKNNNRTLGDYASLELAQVAALKDAQMRKAPQSKEE